MARAGVGWMSCMALAFLVACGGADGTAGPAGPAGPDGPAGPPGQDAADDPSVSAVFPSYAFLERRSQIAISGYGTEWSGSPTVDFGPGISVDDVTVASPTALLVTIRVAPSAALGTRDVHVESEGGSVTYQDAFDVEAPLDVLVVGTQAQGSILFARGEMLDKSTPFDTLSSSNFDIQAGTSSLGIIQDAAAYTLEALLFLDVDATAGPTTVVVENGLPGGEISSRAPGAFTTAARAPTPIVAGAPTTVAIQQPLSTQLLSFTTNPGVVTLVSASASNPAASPAFVLLPDTGRFEDLLSYGTQASLPATPAGATYYIVYWDNSGASGYDATIALTELPSDDVEPNDACNMAQAASLPANLQNLSLSSTADEDWFAITVDAVNVGGRIRMVTSPGDATTDTVVELFASDCTTSVGGPSDDENYHEDHTSAPLTAAGTYYVRVSHSTFPYAGALYNLDITLIPPAGSDAYEPNNVCAMAAPVSLPASLQSLTLPDELDEDWFAVTASAADVGGRIQVMTTPGDVDTDTVIDVLASDCTTSLGGPSSDVNYHENFTSSPIPAAGTYYVRVFYSTFAYAGSEYNLSIGLLPPPIAEIEPNNSSAQANAIPGTAQVTASINPMGDNDWFAVDAPAGATISATTSAGGGDTCGPSGDIDTELEIYDPNGISLVFSEDISGLNNWCSSASTPAASGGTYFVRVASSFEYAPDEIFNYTLSVVVTP